MSDCQPLLQMGDSEAIMRHATIGTIFIICHSIVPLKGKGRPEERTHPRQAYQPRAVFLPSLRQQGWESATLRPVYVRLCFSATATFAVGIKSFLRRRRRSLPVKEQTRLQAHRKRP